MSERLSQKLDKFVALGVVGALAVGSIANRETGFGELIFNGDSANVSYNPTATPTVEVSLNDIGLAMQADLPPYQLVDADDAYRDAKSTGEPFGHHYGEQISVEDAMRYYYLAGFRGKDLIIMTAIAGKESSYYPASIGDVDWNYDGDRSIGLSGMYCQSNGPIGCSGPRNWKDNFDPYTNARNAYSLYLESWENNGHGSGKLGLNGRFMPWESDPEGTESNYDRAEEAYKNNQEQYGNLG